MNKYAQIIAAAVKAQWQIEPTVELTRPDPKFGDYATNIAMQLARELHQAPRQIAETLQQKLTDTAQFSEVTIAGPGFINLRVKAADLMQNLNADFQGDQPFGENNDGQGKKVLVEYPSTNMAKPFSVGHLRSANQGWAARNLMRATGWQVITDNHLGDYGSPFGIWVTGFKKFSDEARLKARGVYELGDIYIKTKAAMKAEEQAGQHTLADTAQSWLLKLEAGDPEAVAFSQRFNQISLDHIHRVMQRLGISTDYELGEKFFAERGKAAVKRLLEQGIAIQNPDGSVIVDLTEYGIKTPMLVLKSNGAALYATTDLATMLYRDHEFHVDRVIYCVASEQKFYFEQLFAMAKKIGLKTEMIHMWYGLIDQINEDGTREKMSSRKGVVLLEDLLNEAERRARQNAKAKDISDDDIKKIAVGAIKFSDFAADRRTGMLFNWDTMFSLTGFSGPYVQYAAVRVNKILADHPLQADLIDHNYDYDAERAVILKLLDYPSIVRLAANNLEPHRLATYAYELAKTMNRYYEQTGIATDDVPAGIKQARLMLLSHVAAVFSHCLNLLGIAVPHRM